MGPCINPHHHHLEKLKLFKTLLSDFVWGRSNFLETYFPQICMGHLLLITILNLINSTREAFFNIIGYYMICGAQGEPSAGD